MSLSLVTGHIRRQRVRRVVPRPDVERRLDEVPAGGLGVLIAPTGSGKSVLVSQWLASTPGQRVAVLTLAPRHTDIAVLARDLVATIRSVAPQVDPRLASLAATGQATLGHPLVDALLDGLASAPHDSVLVFEDAHELSNHPVIGDLGHLFTALPPTARGVVAMRSDPPWSLHQLRLDDRLVEIRGADLAFAEADAQALLEDVSRTSLTDAQVALLVERTDGWAAGLQLAAISLRTSRDIPGFVESFAGSDHLVSEYLLHEVIDEQEPAVRQFLLQTSVLDWLSADLCNAVTGLEIAAGMLDGLFHRSMFLIPLDEAAAIPAADRKPPLGERPAPPGRPLAVGSRARGGSGRPSARCRRPGRGVPSHLPHRPPLRRTG